MPENTWIITDEINTTNTLNRAPRRPAGDVPDQLEPGQVAFNELFNRRALDEYHKILKPKMKEIPEEFTVNDWFKPRIIPQVIKGMAAHPGAILYGIELEIERWPVNPNELSSTGFKFVEDGSLRNNGYEAVSLPSTWQGILSNCSELWHKYKITSDNFSDRTSIHIHANCVDFPMKSMQALATVYLTLEDLIFTFIGEDRRKNIFCVPWAEAGVRTGTVKALFDSVRGWQKYTALNLAPLREQGTVEWRHMEGHADITRLQSWIVLIDEIMQYSKGTTGEKVLSEIQNLNTTSEYHQWVNSVIPKSIHLFTDQQIRSKLARGVIEAKILTI